MNNYPPGAEFDPRAPWNQSGPPEKEIEVTVSITLSKTVKVKVDDYTCEEEYDDEGHKGLYYDYSDCDLKQAVKNQIPLPNDKGENFSDWYEDDFEVNLD